jgi:DNA-binding NtrC family response regulator
VNDPASILIVDDDAAFGETLGDVLRLHDYDVETVTSAHAALDVLATRPARAAIVDLRLPDMSGLELLEAVKVAAPATEVIVVTGHASLRSAILAVNRAAFAYLTKPLEADDLLATVAQALDKQRLTESLRASEERPSTPRAASGCSRG